MGLLIQWLIEQASVPESEIYRGDVERQEISETKFTSNTINNATRSPTLADVKSRAGLVLRQMGIIVNSNSNSNCTSTTTTSSSTATDSVT